MANLVRNLFLACVLIALGACATAGKKPVAEHDHRLLKEEATEPMSLQEYEKRVRAKVGERWYALMNTRLSALVPGTVKLSFTIEPDGCVTHVRVLSNTANESVATVCIDALMEAKIPPIPPNLLSVLEEDPLESDYTFSVSY